MVVLFSPLSSLWLVPSHVCWIPPLECKHYIKLYFTCQPEFLLLQFTHLSWTISLCLPHLFHGFPLHDQRRAHILFQRLTLPPHPPPPFFSVLNEASGFFPTSSHCCLHKLLYPIMLAHVLSRSVESTLCWLVRSRIPHEPSLIIEENLSWTADKRPSLFVWETCPQVTLGGSLGVPTMQVAA